ncbi:MAG: hypothetical protein ACE5FG_03160, partial [Myxococcota bacterium]
SADGLPFDCPTCGGTPLGTQTCTTNADAFCVGGSNDGQPCTDPFLNSDCPSGNCLAISHTVVNILTPLLTTTALFDLPLTEMMAIDCDVPNPVSGIADCDCSLIEADPIDLGSFIGVACITGMPGCETGHIDCNGGSGRDTEVQLFHSVGFCGQTDDPNGSGPLVGPSECEDLCETHCASLPGFRVHRSGCEGYCRGGDLDGTICRNDIDCCTGFDCATGNNGECVGSEPVLHEKHCQCECIAVGGAPSRTGALECQVGLSTVVEDSSGDPSIQCRGIANVTLRTDNCVPMSTEFFRTTIFDANRKGAPIGPIEATGSPVSCDAYRAGQLTGLSLAGQQSSFDSALGDLGQPVFNVCR